MKGPFARLEARRTEKYKAIAAKQLKAKQAKLDKKAAAAKTKKK